jgi:anti-sigma B factor antagonist
MEDCRFDYEDRDGARIVRVHGEVDIYSAPKLETAITAAESDAPALVVVDLRDCRYMDSSAFRVLIKKHESLDSRMFVVVDSTSFARRLFQITGLDKHLRIVADLEALFLDGGPRWSEADAGVG